MKIGCQYMRKICWYDEPFEARRVARQKNIPASCSKRPSARPQAYPRGVRVEDFDEPRTKLAAFFSSLLRREELFGIGGSKTTELSAVADAVQDRHLQALQRELLVPDLFECGDTEGESSLKFRGLRQPFLL